MFERARARYLAALGLEGAAALVLSACQPTPSAPPEPVVTIASTTPSAAEPTASASASGSASPALPPTSTQAISSKLVTSTGETILDACPAPPSPSASAGVGLGPRFPLMPSCPRGDYCVDAPKPAPSKGAPAPYAMCAETVGPPSEVGFPGAPKPNASFSADVTKAQRSCHPEACCYHWVIPCAGGRALRPSDEDVIATPLAARADWLGEGANALSFGDLASSARDALARHWERQASFEHASVASFARASLELLALGAPPDLLRATHAAAIDEIAHAEIAYRFASLYGDRPVGPAALPAAALSMRAPTFAELALATFRDACVGETAASIEARAAADLAASPAVARALERIAADEERHAELGWRTLAWALGAGGAPAIEAVAAAAREIARSIPVAADRAPGDLDLSSHGVLGAGVAARLHARSLAEVVLPCVAALLTERRARLAASTRVAPARIFG